MPEISAFSLQSALTPATAAPLENAGVPAEPGAAAGSGTPAPSFDALLALQATAQAATALLPESGKTLPDAANAVAAQSQTALPQAILMKATAARPVSTRSGEADAPAEALPEVPDETATSAAEVALQPDIALFAAIFAAPDRLAPVVSEQPAAAPAPTAPATAATAASTPAAPAAVATAIAQSAQIELIPATQKGAVPRVAPAVVKEATPAVEQASDGEALPAAPLLSSPTMASATSIARPVAAPLEADAQTAMPGDADPRKAASATPEAIKPQLTEAAAPSAIVTDAPLQAETQPVAAPTRSEARAERIDFATLVDTLARAREDVSPRSINVAVTNTDFGRVSMRFDSTDTGLSVTMSSADPGFARAISASSDAAATSADTRGQNQQGQSDARATAHDANAQRQQQGQNQQGQQQNAGRTDARMATSAQSLTRREDPADKTSDSGIYA